ncbi:hypothetical protein BC332_23778 [Capsicum chinense]|nr:hypothetical protein BC332_23778 [Capsicum chinense]
MRQYSGTILEIANCHLASLCDALIAKLAHCLTKMALTLHSSIEFGQTLYNGKYGTINGNITTELPPSQGFTISHANCSIVASPFKRKAKNEPVTDKDIKSVFEQNNYTNKYLHTLGEYLTSKPSLTLKSEASTSSSPLFKPYEISTTFIRELQMHNSKYFPLLSDLQRRIIQIEKSLHQNIPETPGMGSSAIVGVLQQDGSDDS